MSCFTFNHSHKVIVDTEYKVLRENVNRQVAETTNFVTNRVAAHRDQAHAVTGSLLDVYNRELVGQV